MKPKTTKFTMTSDINSPIAWKIGIVTMVGNKVTIKPTSEAKRMLDQTKKPKRFLAMVRQMAKILGHNGKRRQVSVVGQANIVFTLSLC